MPRRHWIHAWLLLLPAFVFLIAFTHYPAVQTLIDSFWSTPKGRRPSVFVGAENYTRMMADPVFAKAMWNSAIYAALTIPTSIVLSLAMALFVQARFAGVSLMRMAFFTPTVLPLIAVANIWLFSIRARVFGAEFAPGAECSIGLGSANNYVGPAGAAQHFYAVAGR